MVGSVAGQRYWSSMLNDKATITCGIWTPDDQQVNQAYNYKITSRLLRLLNYIEQNSVKNFRCYRRVIIAPFYLFLNEISCLLSRSVTTIYETRSKLIQSLYLKATFYRII